ncbi:MAG: MGMT family protein [Planctomycetota bacterium]
MAISNNQVETPTEGTLRVVPTDSAELDCVSLDTPLGWTAVVASSTAVVRLAFGHASRMDAENAAWRDLPDRLEALGERLDLDSLADDLLSFAEGEPIDLSSVPVSRAHLTAFGRSVSAACQAIGWGERLSYGQLADACGRPRAARAVGSVMARNLVPLIVPCHRVLGSGGKLGGYSAPDGLEMKRRLLARETMF